MPCPLVSQPLWFRGGCVFKAHIFVYHLTLGLRVMKKKKMEPAPARTDAVRAPCNTTTILLY